MYGIRNFKCVQTFYIDTASVKNSDIVAITSLDLFFKNKVSTNNTVGILKPGICVFLCPTNSNGIPLIKDAILNSRIRKEYDDINISSDASVATKFSFDKPVLIKTNTFYGIIIVPDESPNHYDLWSAKIDNNEYIVGTLERITNRNNQYIGTYFDYFDSDNLSTARPLNNVDLKFKIYCAKYNFQQTLQDGFRTSIIYPSESYEFITYDIKTSNNIINAEKFVEVYQNSVIQPFTVSVIENNDMVYTTNGNFNSIYNSSSNEKQYMILFNGSQKNIREIANIVSNTAIKLVDPVTFSNNNTTFSKAPVAIIQSFENTTLFGKSEKLLLLVNSNANSQLRFTNNVIENIIINNGGSNYSNSDLLIIYGGNPNGSNSELNATATLTVNSTGGITNTFMISKGIGFLSVPQYMITNSTGGSSNGSNANLSFEVGSTLITENNVIFANTTLVNIPINSIKAGAGSLYVPKGTNYDLKISNIYYGNGNNIVDIFISNGGISYANNERFIVTGSPTGSGASGYIQTDSTGKIVDFVMQSGGNNYSTNTTINIITSSGTGVNAEAILGLYKNNTVLANSDYYERYIDTFNRHNLKNSNIPQILSRSYEVLSNNITYTTITGQNINTNSSSILEMIVTSNNEYVAPVISGGEVFMLCEKYTINNTYRNEHLGDGDAISKHISRKINFAEDRTAEDLRVYLRAYRPVNSDIKVFARLHNTKDPEPFDDKNWTLLEQKTNIDVFSDQYNENSYIEYEYGLYPYPNSQFTSTGVVTTSLSSSTITGSNTNFQTGSNTLSSGDLIKIYSPLFPNNYMVAVVNSIASNTSLTINTPISNNNLVGSGFKIDKLEYKNQGFNNWLNGNTLRYYNSTMSEFDGFNTFSIKIVFLSTDGINVPKIDDTRGIGVTA